MKLLVLYHPHSESARIVEEYANDLIRNRGEEVELMSLETRDGAALASLYDVVRYPALVAIDELGQPHQTWQGEELPLKDEVCGYLAA